VRVFVRQPFGVRFDSHSEPLRFEIGLNDIPADLLAHGYVKAHLATGNLKLITEGEPQ